MATLKEMLAAKEAEIAALRAQAAAVSVQPAAPVTAPSVAAPVENPIPGFRMVQGPGPDEVSFIARYRGPGMVGAETKGGFVVIAQSGSMYSGEETGVIGPEGKPLLFRGSLGYRTKDLTVAQRRTLRRIS
jgi:hypothetical protein